jgi:hypothetical protein
MMNMILDFILSALDAIHAFLAAASENQVFSNEKECDRAMHVIKLHASCILVVAVAVKINVLVPVLQ